MNLTEANSSDRLRIAATDESTSYLNFHDLPNDAEKITEFKKQLENFVIKDEEDLIGDLSQIVPDSRPYNKELYDSILLNARSSRALCQKFESEPSGLLKSDAQDREFSLESILLRMKSGHKIYKYNYNTPTRKIVTIKINLNIVEIYRTEKAKSRIRFFDVFGLTIGAVSSTFKMNKTQVDYKFGKLHTPEDCFSVISEFRSFDFATTSALAKYDICLSLSWLCSLNNSLQSNVPFTKCKSQLDYLTYKSIIEKLKREAKIKFLSIHEVFLLAIYKTMKQMENTKGMDKIVMILNKRFSFSGKLHRFIKFIVMPLIGADTYIRREIKDKIRVNLLVANKLKTLSQTLNREVAEDNKLIAKTKKTVMESMIVPGCKSIFKKAKSNDPFLAILRQKAVAKSK